MPTHNQSRTRIERVGSRIIEIMKGHGGPMTTPAIMKAFGQKAFAIRTDVNNALNHLTKLGLVVKLGQITVRSSGWKANARVNQWQLTKEGETHATPEMP